MRGGAQFNDVILLGTKVGGRMELTWKIHEELAGADQAVEIV
jgi:hypothetical protein